jgi:Leucine-rich repeat (LRR) protein
MDGCAAFPSKLSIVWTALVVVASLFWAQCEAQTACTGDISYEEYYALEGLYNATGGANWTWDSTESVDTIWQFPSTLSAPCSNDWQGLACEVSNVVGKCFISQLLLDNKNLIGQIPTSVSNFTALQLMIMSSNKLGGSIPSSIAELTTLQILRLDINRMTGTIPSQLGYLVNLRELYFDINRLSGQLPSSLADISALTYFSVPYCGLTGPIPSEYSRLVNLTTFIAFNNALTGTIFPVLAVSKSMTILEVSTNMFTGVIESDVGKLTQLQIFEVGYNYLSSSFPSDIGSLTSLEQLSCGDNLFSGPFPSQLNQMTVIDAIYLFENMLTGPIPKYIGTLVTLTQFEVYENALTGQIPTSLGLLTAMTTFLVHFNFLTGNLPSELGSLQEVSVFYADNNYLTGTLASELAYMSRVVTMEVQLNYFTGSLSSEFGQLQQLSNLLVGNNILSETVPSQLGDLTQLEQLVLFYNMFSSTIPSEIGRLENLVVLYLNNNFFVHDLPSQLFNMRNLQVLTLENNLFSGSIPSLLGNLLSLQVLMMSNNQYIGSIPSSLARAVNMSQFDASFNSLSGSIPTELSLWYNLSSLELNNNNLQGQYTLHFSEALVNLNISSNQLSGAVFEFITGSEQLRFMNVAANSFTGTLPLVGTIWRDLQVFNISSNLFRGGLSAITASSSEYESLRALVAIDVSNNTFTGTLSEDLFSLPNLQSIILSQNCFEGTIPASICRNSALETLILDSLTQNCGNLIPSSLSPILGGFIPKQYMSGQIPSCVWNMTSLQVMHVLGNGLSGTLADLPADSQLTIVAAGSNELSGSIPLSFQTHSFQQLDVSGNRLDGTLSSDLALDSLITSVFSLNDNRISGDIPAALYSIRNRSIYNYLQGNLFGCKGGDVPTSDSNHQSYECGSGALQYSFVAWSIGCMIVILTFFAGWVIGNVKWNLQVATTPFFKLATVSHLCLGILAGVIPLVGYPLFKLPSEGYATYSNQYWWTVTVAFLQGWQIVLFLLLLLSVSSALIPAIVLSVIQSSPTLENVVSSVTSNLAPLGQRLSAAGKIIFMHSSNFVVVLAVNAGYVLEVVNQLSGVDLLFVQTALSLFKIAWSVGAIPQMARLAVAKNQRLPHIVFMSLFLFIGAPFTSTFCESSSCFLNLISRPSSLTSSFPVPTLACAVNCGLECIDTQCHTSCVDYCTHTLAYVTVNVLPPWLYSYQCSSAVVTDYSPVLILAVLLSGVAIPSLLLLYSHVSRQPWFPHSLKLNSSLLCSSVEAASRLYQTNKRDLTVGRNLLIKLFLDMTIILTFGLACPPLTFAVVFQGFTTAVTRQILMERFTRLCIQGGIAEEDVHRALLRSFEMKERQVHMCLYIMMAFVGIFWSLFVFDMIGDVYGASTGALCMIVPLTVPMLLCHLLIRKIRLSRDTESFTDSKFGAGYELETIGTPLSHPQNAEDSFQTKSTTL